MAVDEKTYKILERKNKSGVSSFSVSIPRQAIQQLKITDTKRDRVKLTLNGDRLYIEKA